MSAPSHWQDRKLGDMGEISGGGTPSTSVADNWGGGIPWLVPSEVSRSPSLYVSATNRTITDKGLSSSVAKLLPIGTVMMTSRATIGEVVINRVPMATNQGFINVVCNPQIVQREFLAYWIKQNKQIFVERAHGVTFKEITKSNFKSIPISLPSIDEQRAIAEALDTVQRAKEARRRELALERERKAALMEHLFTHGTRGEPTKQTEIGEIPDGWRTAKIDSTLRLKQYGLSVRGSGTGTVPILRMNNLVEGKIEPTNLQWVDLDARTQAAYMLRPGDVLFNRTNSQDLVGKTGLFDHDGAFVFASYLVRLTFDESVAVSPFMNAYLNLASTQRRLKGIASRGVSQSNISAGKLGNFLVPVPSLDEQREIATVSVTLDKKIRALTREEVLLNEFFQATLEELMTGRLSAIPLIEENQRQ